MKRYAATNLQGEANFRSIFDVILMNAIWHPQTGHFDGTHVTMEPVLSLPKASHSGVRCLSVTPDSAFCIDAGPELLTHSGRTLRAFSSLANQQQIDSFLLPHLLNGFKSPTTAGPPALRQLQIAMVSALYQRRALRHPEHFVFGIYQPRRSTVHVIAATWVPSPSAVNQSLRDARTMGGPGHASTSKVTIDAPCQTSEDLEIKTYILGQFNLAVPIQLVGLYLMVLATMPLADRYRSQVTDDPPDEPAPDFGDWPDEKSWGSKSQTTETRTTGSKRARREALEDASSPDELNIIDTDPALNSGRPLPRSLAKNERKFGDIQRLPKMSSYSKCLHYVQSLPSSV
ncbi:hypothetical protein FRC06_001558 [Ceratobasidium sp. 370]|nr:hypothetical protein FRC06_001558 [Ceratobasidium sp. 370]